MPVTWVDRSVDCANVSDIERGTVVDRHAEAVAFDQLSERMRRLLRLCVSDFSAVDAAAKVKRFGEKQAAFIIMAADRAATREVLRAAYPGHPALVNA